MKKDVIICARDDFELHGILREPVVGPIRGSIQICSGWGLRQGRYAEFAQFLSEAGFATLTFDYRGVGRSQGVSRSRLSLDMPMRHSGETDMPAVLDWLINRYPGLPRILIGHSLGGQVIGLMDNCDKLDRIYTIGTATGYFKDLSRPFNWLLPHVFFKMVPAYVWVYRNVGFMRKIMNRWGVTAEAVIEWKNWCGDPEYFKPQFGTTMKSLHFDKILVPFIAIRVGDDPYANDATVPKLHAHYSNAKITERKIHPLDIGMRKIGHSGYFSKKFKDPLWRQLLGDIEESLPR